MSIPQPSRPTRRHHQIITTMLLRWRSNASAPLRPVVTLPLAMYHHGWSPSPWTIRLWPDLSRQRTITMASEAVTSTISLPTTPLWRWQTIRRKWAPYSTRRTTRAMERVATQAEDLSTTQATWTQWTRVASWWTTRPHWINLWQPTTEAWAALGTVVMHQLRISVVLAWVEAALVQSRTLSTWMTTDFN